MSRSTLVRLSSFMSLLMAMIIPGGAEEDTAAMVYRTHCASCHGADRLGGQGPALIPQSLKRLRKKPARKVIAAGRPATQMPAFADILNEKQLAEIVSYIFEPLVQVPEWGRAQIEASRTVIRKGTPELHGPRFDADPRNLFVVVEAGDHHATILDGDKFSSIHRFKTRFALHGGPKFSPDGRYVFFASRDGWVSRFDLWSLEVTAEIRAGINTRNVAISNTGKYLAVANYLPHTLVILRAFDLSLVKIFDVRNRHGATSRVSAVYQAPQRSSFVAALKDVSEIWEISTDPNSRPVYEGFVHNYKPGHVEALSIQKGLFSRRRIQVEQPLDDFFFDQSYRHLIGSSRKDNDAVVVNLNVGRPVARIDLPGFPHLGAGTTWTWRGRRVMAAPHLKNNLVSVIDMQDWSVIKRIPTKGPGFFMRSHERSRYAWVDVFFGPNRDLMHVIDKQTLEIAKTLRPEPGKTSAHVEFDKYGRHALVSIWDIDGAIVVYDANTLNEIKRIPMSKPSGKYNVQNKIKFSEGTSH